jgi:acetate kinase
MRDPDGNTVSEIRWPEDADHDYDHLLDTLLSDLESPLEGNPLRMIGHRVVHGGRRYAAPILVDDAVLAALEDLTPMAPLHQSHNLTPIRALRRLRPDAPQLACFDTAFHSTMPAVATAMALTGLDGLVMGTRTGTIDPGALLYLLQAHGMTPSELEDLLYRRAGLLGISGISSDMRTLLASDDTHAAEAIELFVYRAAREIAAMAVSLGGLDGIVFTAGIGEHAPEIRDRIITRLGWLGAEIDPEANAAGGFVIAAGHSQIDIRVLPTDEEAMIGLHCLEQLATIPDLAEAFSS